MERLQTIIQKLEAKLKPLHEENQELKFKLEELQLDHELALEQARVAELELAESAQQSKRFKELSDQVEALETLKKLSDELERDQREEIAQLECQLLQLELASHDHNNSPNPVVNDPSDTLKQQLSLLKLELEAAKYELRRHQIGLLDFLNEVSPGFDLERMRYMISTYGDKSDSMRLETLFNAFKSGSVGTRDLLESIKQVASELDSRAQITPKFNPQAARVYLLAITQDQRVDGLPETSLAKLLDDTSLLEEVIEAASERGHTSDNLNTSKEHPAPSSSELSCEQAEHAEQLETLKLKLEILSGKAAKAAQLAVSLNDAEIARESIQAHSQKLESHIAELRDQLAAKETEIITLKAAKVPDMDSMAYQHTLGLLSDTIKLLHTRTTPFVLKPLSVGPARNLSAFAGTQIVNQVWDAIDTFQVPNRRRKWIEQMGKLSLIDSM